VTYGNEELRRFLDVRSLPSSERIYLAADVMSREMDPVVADAEIARMEAQFQHTDDHLKRLEPLLPKQFVTEDRVEEARTHPAPALAALNEARARKVAAVAGVHARPTCCHGDSAAPGPHRAVSRRGRHRPDRGYQCQDSCG